MQQTIDSMMREASQALDAAASLKEVQEVKVKYLGKNGLITGLMKELKSVPNAEKPAMGKLINTARDVVSSAISTRENDLKQAELIQKTQSEAIDITLNWGQQPLGALHPTTLVLNEIIDIFTGLGFEVKEGPEIETDYFCFQALNIPKDHPARDMQDTFYVSEDVVLRTHTSPAQPRTMLKQKPPLKMVTPGKVYRCDDDATHSPMFQQIEGLAVDKGINLCHLKGVLEEFAKKLFDEQTKTRFRPSYFPFTEPSVEVDVTCSVCHGKGCRICKGTGWIEILGAGIVNPKVLENCNIDPSIYSGFAFGMGIERVAMIKYGIPDMRILFENDIRFLSQFK